jgi:hypothetical protein
MVTDVGRRAQKTDKNEKRQTDLHPKASIRSDVGLFGKRTISFKPSKAIHRSAILYLFNSLVTSEDDCAVHATNSSLRL